MSVECFDSYLSIQVTYIYLLQEREGGCLVLEVIVHYPETPEKQLLFDKVVAKLHAEFVAQFIEKLNCPTEQKLRLIDAVAKTILEESKQQN